jgi:hypothetical protein
MAFLVMVTGLTLLLMEQQVLEETAFHLLAVAAVAVLARILPPFKVE